MLITRPKTRPLDSVSRRGQTLEKPYFGRNGQKNNCGGRKISRGGRKTSRGGQKVNRGGRKVSRDGQKISLGSRKIRRRGRKISRVMVGVVNRSTRFRYNSNTSSSLDTI